uniref:Putative ovule protein n=1 Tax=Solanum chacoense TaxID=4108 RepID=A0A0V0GMP5_SOLCH
MLKFILPKAILITIILLVTLLTFTTCSPSFLSTKMPTLFLILKLPKYHNLNPSTSLSLVPAHLISWTTYNDLPFLKNLHQLLSSSC